MSRSTPSGSPARPDPLGGGPLVVWLMVGALLIGVIGVRLSGPSDLLDNDQLRPASYITDIVSNGQWLVQRDTLGDIASKPPMCAWISASWAEATGGRVTRLALAMPSIIGIVGMAAVTVWAGSRYLGPRAGWWGALALLLSPMGFKQAILVRTDSLYGFAGALAGIVVWEAMRRGGRTWVLFWIVGAGAVLVKGPLAMVLPLAGLLAWKWPRDVRAIETNETGVERPSALPWHALGVLILVVCVGGWFWLAWRDSGEEFINRILGRELVGHMVKSGAGKPPFAEFYLPPLYYLGRYAPGSVLTAIGLWGVFVRPSAEPTSRRFERFIGWWFVIGLAVFSIAPHQRPDLMTPIWVAGSLIAGREIARLTAGWSVRGRAVLCGVSIALGLVGGVLEHHVHARTKVEVKGEAAIRAMAEDLVSRFGEAPAMMHVSDNSSLQFYLGRRVTKSSPEEAIACMRGGGACVVAVSRKSGVIEQIRDQGVEFFEIARSGGPEEYEVVILGNGAAAALPQWRRDRSP